MNPSARPRLSSLAIALFAGLWLAGCGGPNPKELVASAKDYLAKSDARAAIIQLRNARQAAPNDAEIRFLLGRAYFETGDPSAAEVELRRALELKYPAQDVLPLLAQALVARGEHRKVVTEFADARVNDARARADIATTVAIAALAQGDIKQVQESLKAALAADPKFPRAHVVAAQLALRGGDAAAAQAAVDRALSYSPNDVEAGVMRAEMLAAQGNTDEAVAILEKTAAAHPKAPQVRFTLISMLVGSGKIDRAAESLQVMKKEFPSDFRTVYSEALVLLAKGEAAKARELADKLVALRPDHLPSLYLSALGNYNLKNYAAAEEAVQKVVARAPHDPVPRRLLAAVYVRTGRAAQALETVEGGLRRAPNDAMLLRLAGEARLLTGNIAEATRLYEQAAEAERDGGNVARLRLAQIRLTTGDVDRGMAELAKLAEQGSSIQPEVALLGAHLRKREYDKALAVVGSIEKKQPNTALAPDLRGGVYLAKYDLKEARKHFMRALEIEPNRLSSARSLALIDLQEGKPADARARYEKLIAAQPRNEQPLIALAEILALSGAPPAEVRAALDRAVAANVNAIGPRLALVTHFRRLGDDKGALEAARAAANALPNEPRIVELYGVLQLNGGEAKAARETFSRLTQLLPQSPAPWLRVAEAHIANRDFASAIDAQRKALVAQPDHTPAMVALATTYLMSGKPDDAIAEAKRAQREKPKAGAGFLLEAELLAMQKKLPEAIAAMREAIAREPKSPAYASRLYALMSAAGRTADANNFADRWIKDHPKDAAFLSLVGQQRQSAKDSAGAAAAYRAALEIEPENVVVLNNLAWLLNEQGKPEARDLAERAYRLSPMSPQVVDTLGAVALRQGDTARALALMRQATNIAPQDTRLRINLARALAKSGDKAAAKRELEAVVGREKRAPLKAEAEQLLREL